MFAMTVEHKASTNYYREQYRPQFHFTPEENWMNDPNGMVYYNGEYHLFYQYHPNSNVWGPMHWGHAVSEDLVHWEHLPIALRPDENGMIFSGSAVVDWHDTSGFFGGESGLVAIFTHADEYPGTDKPRQRQSLAYSKDNGRTWKLYEGNPVLSEPRIIDFRDPKVFWHEDTGRWVMVIASGQTVSLYTSLNLKDWEFASEFGEGEGSHQGVWECPDLFQLPVDHSTGVKKWVMLVSLGDEPELEEGSKTQYFVGEFDGKTFVNDNAHDKVLWVDRGWDNYAGVTWSDLPMASGRRVFMGWMSNWRYAIDTPTSVWRSAMTLPRELSLQTTESGVRLIQTPVPDIESIHEDGQLFEDIELKSGGNLFKGLKGNAIDLELDLDVTKAGKVRIGLLQSKKEETIIEYDVSSSTLFFDRRRSGDASFHKSFAMTQSITLQAPNGRLKLRIFVDWSSVEVFGGDGEVMLTNLVFPSEESQGLELSTDGTVYVHKAKVSPLRSVWKRSAE